MRAARASASSMVLPPAPPPLRRADAGILQPGHPFLVELLRDVLDALLDLIDRQLRNESGDETLGPLLQDAGGCSVRIAIDGPARRIGSVLGDVRELQREAVADAVVAHGVREPHRV